MKLGIKGKMLSGFIGVAVIAGIIGLTGLVSVYNMSESNTFLYNKVTQPIVIQDYIMQNFILMRMEIYRELLAETPKDIDAAISRVQNHFNLVMENKEKYEKDLLTEDGKKEFNDFKKNLEKYMEYAEQIAVEKKGGKNNNQIDSVLKQGTLRLV